MVSCVLCPFIGFVVTTVVEIDSLDDATGDDVVSDDVCVISVAVDVGVECSDVGLVSDIAGFAVTTTVELTGAAGVVIGVSPSTETVTIIL